MVLHLLLFTKMEMRCSSTSWYFGTVSAFGCKVFLQFSEKTMVSEKTLVVNTLGCLDERNTAV
jgi:hypothetical protein